MNYLAHLLLSGPNADIQVGGLLGDFVKGPLKGEMPRDIEFGIFLHRKLDCATDTHPEFVAAARQIPPPWRRFRGILLDVYLDHLLANRWHHYHPQPLDDFCQTFYRHIQHHNLLPLRAQHFCQVAPQVRWLESYGDRNKLPGMLNNLGKRLKNPVNLGEALPFLDNAELDLTFETLLADLLSFSAQLRTQHNKP